MDPFFLLGAIPDGRLFALDEQTIVQVVLILLNVGLLAVILSWLLYKPVLQILYERRARILDDIQAAEKDKADAVKLKAEYEQLMKDVEQEKYDILEAARKQAAEKAKEQLAEAKTEAETVRARAQKEISLEQDRVKNEMRQAVINVSSAMVAKVLTKAIDADEQERLFNETLAELEEIAWHN